MESAVLGYGQNAKATKVKNTMTELFTSHFLISPENHQNRREALLVIPS